MSAAETTEIPVSPDSETSRRRAEVVAEYRQAIERLARVLQDRHPAMALVEAIDRAHVAAWKEVKICMEEAARQVGLERAPEVFGRRGASTDAGEGGAPDREPAALRAMRTLAFHAGAGDGPVLDETLEELLADLLHWAGPEGFDDALRNALLHYEAELGGDEGVGGEAAPAAAAERQRARLEARQLAQLRAHRPDRYDA